MPPTSIEALSTTAAALLDAVVTILDTTAPGAPASQFLTPARPAFDCEFVAVQVVRISEDTTAPQITLSTKRRNHFGNLILVTFAIYVVRCAPGFDGNSLPTDAAKTAGAVIVQEDGWALWNGMRGEQDVLFDGCLGIYFDGGVPIDEQGGFMGWTFQIRASIEGYE